MLTKIRIRNFKCFDEVEVELASPVVFIGPNNSGKTTALQALMLWEVGLKRWKEKREREEKGDHREEASPGKGPEKRPGVTINRRDLVAVPVPDAKLLWRQLHVRDTKRSDQGKQETKNIRIDIIVEGITNGRQWECGLEFDYANEEAFYCRPMRKSDQKNPDRMQIPGETGEIKIAFLPPMSGLASNETRLDPGAINVRVGEGRTAEVLRNLCYKIFTENLGYWDIMTKQIQDFFGAEILDPAYIVERGEITLGYAEKGTELDLSCSGRGLQQTLLLLSYMYANPGAVLLLDEPDAHLEILRQRQIYRFLTETAQANGNQIIIASHSEVLLNEAAEKNSVVAFVGKPHLIADRGSQVMKALREIGFDHYYQAEQIGWVLYLEGSTDLSILQKFAEILQFEEAIKALERPFVHYVSDKPGKASDHFYGLREAVSHLKGICILDRLETPLRDDPNLIFLTWEKREIENYLCFPETLESYARSDDFSEYPGPLFAKAEANARVETMKKCIKKVEDALRELEKGSPWSPDTKVSDDFLVPLFKRFFEQLKLPNLMTKGSFYKLARFVPREKIDPEIKETLEAVVRVSKPL